MPNELRVGWLIGAILVAPHVLPAQAGSGSVPQCDAAQVLFISGRWTAMPGPRVLKKWDCLQVGDEVSAQAEDLPPSPLAPAKDKRKSHASAQLRAASQGAITIIYRDSSLAPYSQLCTGEIPCRNAYKVAAPVASKPSSLWQDVLDIFFAHPQPKVVPGILFGKALGDSNDPVAWSDPGRVQSKIGGFGGISGKRSTYQFVSHRPVVLCSDAGKIDVRDISTLYAGVPSDLTISSLPPEQPATPIDSTILDAPAKLYRISARNSAALALIEPRQDCEAVKTQWLRAVALTRTWPATIPEAAKNDFLTLFLENLAANANQ